MKSAPSLHLNHRFHISVAVELGEEEFGVQMMAQHRARGRFSERAVDEPVLFADLAAVTDGGRTLLDLQIVGHRELTPGAGREAAAGVEVEQQLRRLIRRSHFSRFAKRTS